MIQSVYKLSTRTTVLREQVVLIQVLTQVCVPAQNVYCEKLLKPLLSSLRDKFASMELPRLIRI